MTDLIDTIRLENAVGSSSINQEVELKSLEKDFTTSEYDPDTFPGLVYRTTEPTATNLLFRAGKIVTTGAQQLVDIDRSLRLLFNNIDDLGISVPAVPEYTVQNLVCSGDLGETLNLNAIAIGLGLEDIEYEPEQFPYLVYRLDEPPIVVLLFGSGNVVITGATAMSEIEAGIIAVADELTDIGMYG